VKSTILVEKGEPGMSGEFSGFTQARISRAIRAATKAGRHVDKIVILPDGSITLEVSDQVTTKEAEAAA
jgi:hypothetical protein